MLKRKQPLALPKSSHSKFILFYYERPRGRGRPNLFLSVARATAHRATHGDFKVADTVFAEAKAKGYTREQWEDALEKAELRAEQRTEPDEWPLIITDDFF